MKNIRRCAKLAFAFAAITPLLFAGELPNSDGKLDYGIDDLPFPEPVHVNRTRTRTVQLIASAAAAETTPFQKMQLLTELGECRLPEGMATLIAALADEHPGVRASAAAAIAVAGQDDTRSAEARKALLADAKLIPTLEKLLADADVDIAVSALSALVSLQGETSPAIEAAVRASARPLVVAGINAATTRDQAKLIASMLDRFPADVQPHAILALGRCGETASVPALLVKATGSDLQQAVAACEALAMLKSPDAAAILEKLTSAKHPSIRREAMRAFGVCSPDRRLEVATARLADEDNTVRQAAVEVIGANLVPQAVANVVPHLSSEYRPLYLAARQALISAVDDATRQSCIEAAGRLLDDPSPRRQEDGSYVLGHYRSDHKLDRHIALLDFSVEKPDWDLIAQAADSLGRIGRQEARPALVKLVLSRDRLIGSQDQAYKGVNSAIVGAGRLGATEILHACDRILAEDPLRSDVQARSAACFAIGVAGNLQSPGVNRLFSVLHNPMDGAKIEGLKAVGNLKIPGGEARIKEFPGSESHQLQWLIQWATARITGQPAEHPPTVYSWSARTTMIDISGD